MNMDCWLGAACAAPASAPEAAHMTSTATEKRRRRVMWPHKLALRGYRVRYQQNLVEPPRALCRQPQMQPGFRPDDLDDRAQRLLRAGERGAANRTTVLGGRLACV